MSSSTECISENNDLTKKNNNLTVCLDARLTDGRDGGVQQIVIGLASGLAQLTDGNESYLFLCHAGTDQWLRDYLKGPCDIIYSSKPLHLRHKTEAIINGIPFGSAVLRWLLDMLGNPTLKLSSSDGTIEAAGVDVMHFTHQSAFRTKVPSIYHPWDLQHLHLPEYFTRQQRSTRNFKYREFCNQAQFVPVGSEWMKTEIINHFRLDETKVKVIPMAPPVDAYPAPTNKDIEQTRRKFSLSEPFIFYPAQTWAHKNHLGLLKALYIYQKQHNFRPFLVCSGSTNDYFPTIRRKMKRLKLASQVKFIGFISPLELQCLYRLCRFMIFPSKYEGWGLPVTEAMRIGVPLACSKLTILKEHAGSASLFFDPDQPQEIANTIYRLWTDAALREKLSAQGQQIAARFSWQKTAQIFRAYYRLISGKFYTREDQLLVRDQLATNTSR